MRKLLERYNNDIYALCEAMQSKEAIVKPCKECGDKFVFTPIKQLEYEMMGFKPPKRCQKCIDKQYLNKLLSNLPDEQAALFKSVFP